MAHGHTLVATLFMSIASIAAAHPAPGIVVDSKEHVYFVDFTHDRIMTIAADGSPSVFADGARDNRFSVPHHLTIDKDDTITVASDRGGAIWQFKPDGTGKRLYPPLDWSGINFTGSGGDPFTLDDHGNIYCTNSRQFKFSQILRIDSRGVITSLAGDKLGHADGLGAQAQFGELHHAAMICAPVVAGESAGVLYVADASAIRKVMPDGAVTTFAGSADHGNKDGLAGEARFSLITDISWDKQGNLIATDHGNRNIRKITLDGHVTTLPLKPPSPATGASPIPIAPAGAAAGPSGDLYIIDYPQGDSPRVSRVKPDGSSSVIADLSGPKR